MQGAAAAPAIVAAIELAARRAECDVLILARGGGSLEDLWAFNDERVARAIDRCRGRCRAPIVTGIGHEIDFTIADFVADLRAPTPSGAAELVVPDVRTWLHRLEQMCGTTLRPRCAARSAASVRARTDCSAGSRERIRGHGCGARRRGCSSLRAGCNSCSRPDSVPTSRHLQSLARALQAVSPLATLERGFAVITRSADGALVTSAEQLSVGETFDARLASGSVQAAVISKRS